VNYAKLLEISFFFLTWRILLEVVKTQNLSSKIWQTLGDVTKGNTAERKSREYLGYNFQHIATYQTIVLTFYNKIVLTLAPIKLF
jgi:hypothetical protein